MYSITQRGLLELERHGEFLIPLNSSTKQMPDPVQAFHALELTSLRLALASSALLVSWQSELEISSLNMVSEAFQKDYDAIVKIWVGNEIREFALEYERSLKSAKQYQSVRAALEAERMVPCVLYVTVDPNLLAVVLHQLTPIAKRLGFLAARAFREQLLAASVTTEATRAMVTLEEFLRYSHPLYVRSEERTAV